MATKATYATLYIVRHGETDWNLAHRIQGQSDIPLNKTGEGQAKNLQNIFKDIHFSAIFSSDLSRAQKTAELATVEKDIAVTTTELLRERNFGSIEGKHIDEFLQLEKLRLLLTKEEGLTHRHVPDMENEEELIGRVVQFLREISLAYAGKNVLVVTHGGVMRVLLSHLGFIQEHETLLKIQNTAYVKLRSDGIDFFIEETKGIEKQ